MSINEERRRLTLFLCAVLRFPQDRGLPLCQQSWSTLLRERCQHHNSHFLTLSSCPGTSTSGAAALHPRRMRPAASAKGAPERGGFCKSAPPACNQTTHPPWQGSQGGGGGGGGGGDGEDGGHPGTQLSAGRHPWTQPCPILPCTRLQGGWWL